MTTESTGTGKTLLIIAAVVIVAIIGYGILYAPDRRTDAQKIGDAINELPKGVDKATRQLEDRTPADKLEDAAQDAGNDLKKATNQQ
jgi:short subunit fatty acids transporter